MDAGLIPPPPVVADQASLRAGGLGSRRGGPGQNLPEIGIQAEPHAELARASGSALVLGGLEASSIAQRDAAMRASWALAMPIGV